MTNADVATAFLNHKVASTNNLHSLGDRLFSYRTCIAQWWQNLLIGNSTKYSSTSSRHLNYIKHRVNKWTCKSVPRETQTLLDYV